LGLSGAATLVLVALAFQAPAPQTARYAIPAMLLAAWAALLALLIADFQRLPPVATPEMGWWKRTQIGLRRLGYRVLATLFVVTTVVALGVSGRLLAIGFNLE